MSVIIPARNESRQIETVVRSVLGSTYEPLQAIVVDDRSTDDTAERVEQLARIDPRVRLVRGAALPGGWYGKPWACHQGAAAAEGDYLLFTDADTKHDPALLSHAIATAVRDGTDLLTIAPRQLIIGFWERVIMPQIWVMLGVRYHPDSVNRARRPRDVIANGQFMLFSRAGYDALGGHEAVKGEVVEDLALARHVVRAGRKLRFVFAYDLMETRMYRNLGEVVEGWSKNLYLGGRLSYADESWLRPVAPLLMMLHEIFWLTPPVVAAAALAGLAPGWLAPALVAVGFSMLFWGLVSFGMKAPAWYGLLYPLGALAALGIIVRSTLRGRRKVEWRGRTYDETGGVVSREQLP